MATLPNPPRNFYHATADQWEILKPLTREMRHAPTNAENEVWQIVRNRNINGAKFRRQYAIDKFIADFICLSHALILEIDGDIHLYTQEEDQARQAFLEALGFRVLRFTNAQVLGDLATLVRVIAETLTDLTPPTPLSTMERGE